MEKEIGVRDENDEKKYHEEREKCGMYSSEFRKDTKKVKIDNRANGERVKND